MSEDIDHSGMSSNTPEPEEFEVCDAFLESVAEILMISLDNLG